MARDRLQKQISFSKHEKDIYDYLSEQENESGFVKRLILNHMIEHQMEERQKSGKSVKKKVNKVNKVKKQKEKPVEVEEIVPIIEETVEDENWKIAQELDL